MGVDTGMARQLGFETKKGGKGSMELLVRSTPTHFSTNVSMAWYAWTGQKIQHLLTYKMVKQMTVLSVNLCRANTLIEHLN